MHTQQIIKYDCTYIVVMVWFWTDSTREIIKNCHLYRICFCNYRYIFNKNNQLYKKNNIKKIINASWILWFNLFLLFEPIRLVFIFILVFLWGWKHYILILVLSHFLNKSQRKFTHAFKEINIVVTRNRDCFHTAVNSHMQVDQGPASSKEALEGFCGVSSCLVVVTTTTCVL